MTHYLILPLLYTALVFVGLYIIKKDKEFDIILTGREKVRLIICSVLAAAVTGYTGWICGYAAVVTAAGLAYLNISAITDSRTKLVYFSPLWVLLVLSVLCESLLKGHFSCFSFILFAFPMIMGLLGLYGMGDVPMCMTAGLVFFFLSPDSGAFHALFMECVVILVAEVGMYIQAVMQKNLKNPFRLKESRPLGPHLQAAAYLVLLAEIIMKYRGYFIG